MPRKSKAALAVASVVEVKPRPEPPDCLTDDQAEIWLAVVNHQEAEWFNAANLPLLEAYCRHVAAGRKVSYLIAQAEHKNSKVELEDYDRLLKMQEREGRAASSLATRMRLSQQAQYDAKRKNKEDVAENPLTFKG